MLAATVVPRTVTLPVGLAEWTVTVREELTHGDDVAMQARMYRESDGGKLSVDHVRYGDAMVLAYLVDWTLTDAGGQRIEIAGKSASEVQDVLTNLRRFVYREVHRVIDAHDDACRAREAELKKTSSGAAPSAPTLHSVA